MNINTRYEKIQVWVNKNWEGYLYIIGGIIGLFIGFFLSVSYSNWAFLLIAVPVSFIATTWTYHPSIFWGALIILVFFAISNEPQAWYGVGILVLLEIILEISQHFLRAPLHSAVKNGDIEKIKTLIKENIDVNEIYDGTTPIHIAAHLDYMDIVALFLAEGVDINLRTKNENTPLLSAAFNGNLEIVKLLVEKGADIQSKNVEGQSALHMAAYRGYAFLATYLLSSGADVKELTVVGKTAYDLALENGHIELANMFNKGSEGYKTSIPEEDDQRKVKPSDPNFYDLKTKINIELDSPTHAELVILNQEGQKIKTLINKDLSSGEWVFYWYGKDDNNEEVKSGIYFYQLKTEKGIEPRKEISLR